MNMRCVIGKYVTPSWYASLAVALLVAGGSACAADAHQPEVTVEPSEPPVAAAGDATPVPKIVAPEDAVEFPRAVALKQARHITVVHHDDAAAASSGVAGEVQ